MYRVYLHVHVQCVCMPLHTPTHIHPPPIHTPTPTLSTDEDAESGIHPTGDQSEMDTSAPTPLTPHDPTLGLPQSRPRLFSSDVSEDGGSRRSSISEHMPHRDTRSEVAKESGDVSLFETVYQKELVKSETAKTESSKVTSSEEPGDKDDTMVAKKPQLPPLRLMSTGSDTVLPSQQPPLSPLIRSPSFVSPIRQGLPVLSPLRTSALKALTPMVDTPPLPTLKPSPDLVPKESITMETQQSPPREKPQMYQVPGSPQKVRLKEFHVSAEKLPLTPVRRSTSPTFETSPRSRDSESKSHDSEVESHDQSHEPTPVESPPTTSPQVVASEDPLPATDVGEVEEGKDEMEVTSVEAVGGDEVTKEKEGVVELEEVLSQLSETESSEYEEAPNDEKEDEEPSDTHAHVDARVSDSSVPSTPTPPPSRPHTPCSHLYTPPLDSYSPIIPDQSYLSPPQPVEDLEPSEDNLSISAEGSDSDTEAEPSQDSTVVASEEAEFVERGDSPSGEGSDSDTEPELPRDDTSEIVTNEGVELTDEKQNSPADLSEFSEPEKKIVEQVTEIESSVLLPTSFEGEVSVEVGESRDDSSEMINTLSAQVKEDYSEVAKVLEQELSSDDEDSETEEPVFKPEGEPQGEGSGPTCVLTTSTEKVKGETTGRKRTVSKEDVLGICKPVKKPRKRRRKGGIRPQRVSSVSSAPAPEASLPVSLVVSIKKSLYEAPSQPSPLPVTPTPSPPTVTSEPLIITINRHLLRHPKLRLHSLTPEEKPKPLDRLKIRLAKFGNPSASTPKPVRSDFETTPTSAQASPLGPRKRELDVSPKGEDFIKRPKLEPQVHSIMVFLLTSNFPAQI